MQGVSLSRNYRAGWNPDTSQCHILGRNTGQTRRNAGKEAQGLVDDLAEIDQSSEMVVVKGLGQRGQLLQQSGPDGLISTDGPDQIGHGVGGGVTAGDNEADGLVDDTSIGEPALVWVKELGEQSLGAVFARGHELFVALD